MLLQTAVFEHTLPPSTRNEDGTFVMPILISKSRVAPIKIIILLHFGLLACLVAA